MTPAAISTPVALYVYEAASPSAATASALTTLSAFSSPTEAYLYDIRQLVYYIFIVVAVYIFYRLIRTIFL